MPFGFGAENTIEIRGDGNGFIVIQEWTDDEHSDLLGEVRISVQRFEDICEHFRKELISEAWSES